MHNLSMKWVQVVLGLTMVAALAFPRTEAQGLTVTIKDLPQAGLTILTSHHPAFAGELEKMGLESNHELVRIGSSAVILKNASKRSVVAFAVNWTVVDNTNVIRTRGFNYIQPSGLLDGSRAKREKVEIEQQIRPGAARLLTANGMARTAQELRDLAITDFTSTVTGVELDLAVFDDGEAVGPNRLGLMERFAAYVDAEQDLVQEVDGRISKGENLPRILADIRSRLAPDSGAVPLTPTAVYDHNLRIYLAELETTLKNFGEDETRKLLAHRKYSIRPTIHRQPGINRES